MLSKLMQAGRHASRWARLQSVAMKTILSFTFAVIAAAMIDAQTTTPGDPQQAPPPGSPGIHKSNAELMAVLKAAVEPPSGMTTSPVALTDQYRINIVRRRKGAGAIAHPGNSEVHYIIEGSATFVSGGTIVRTAGGPGEIRDGAARRVSKGDVLVIPADSPHWYKEIDGAITYLEVRFVAPAK